jgi:hypothetical protein
LDIGNRLNRDRDFAGWIDDFRLYAGAGDLSFAESVRQSAAGPAGLLAAAGNNQVALIWNPLLGAVSYNVKRSSTCGGPFTTISTSGTVLGTNYIDSTATNGGTYYYVVSAVTFLGPAPQTANSPTEAGIILPTPPPAPAASYNSPLYAGMTMNLSASPVAGASYNWSGPGGFVSAIQNPSIANVSQNASGTYSVTATVGGLTSTPGSIAVTINPPLTFSVQKTAGNLIFNWPFGALQSATNLMGPWTAVSTATSPFTNTPAGPQQFYRVQLQ